MPTRIARFIKDPYCGLSHWVGSLLSIVGLVVLLILADGRPWHVVGFALYGASLIVLYTASALAHSIHCSPETESRLDRFDFAAIFLLIAGTYTPLCLISLRGPWGWTLLAI
jgi:hemolysin III